MKVIWEKERLDAVCSRMIHLASANCIQVQFVETNYYVFYNLSDIVCNHLKLYCFVTPIVWLIDT